MNIKERIFIPSFGRWDSVKTYEYLGCGRIVVPKAQEAKYRKRYGDAVFAIDDSRDGCVSRKRNAVLDIIEERVQDASAIMIDDDLVALRRKKEAYNLDPEQCLEVLENMMVLFLEGGFTFGGFDYSSDNMKLKDYQPFSLTKASFGLVYVRSDDGIRYDERFRVNEDVEFWVQKMNRHRRVIKDNRYFANFFGEDGGKGSIIGYSVQDRKTFAQMINDKWGRKLMIWRKKRFEFKSPIKGA